MPDELKAASPKLLHAQSLSLPVSLTVAVDTPCEGTQTVDKSMTSNMYQGTAGDFTLVVLYPVEYSGELTWEFKVWDYDAGSGCYGITTWRRTTPGEDPTDIYCMVDNNQPDCDEGQGAVGY